MAKEKRSRIRKRRGCLSGCLARLLMLLGFLALVFVGVHLFGFVQNDEETGEPRLTFGKEPVPLLPGDIGNGISALLSSIPSWPYGIRSEGMTLKILRGGRGQALLLCCDGYTAMIGGGSETYSAGLQMLLCGVSRLDAAVIPSSDGKDAGGMAFVIQTGKPSYLFLTGIVTQTAEWQRMEKAFPENRRIIPTPGLSFNLGRGRVTFVGPGSEGYTANENRSLSLRVDYGGTSILIPGRMPKDGEQNLLSSRAVINADVLIAANGGEEGATGESLIAAVKPRIAVCTGNLDWRVKARLQSAGAAVYTVKEHGVMTIRSDGTDVRIEP